MTVSRAPAGERPRLAWPGVVLALAAYACCWILLGQGFYGRESHNLADTNDVRVYQSYGEGVRAGLLPYRDFGLVYPPGALPVFYAPAVVAGGSFGGYLRALSQLMALCGLGGLLLVVAVRAPPAAVAFVALSPLLVGSLLLRRFDLWPTALVLAALLALGRDRHRLGFAALAAATAAKLFALVALPLAVVWTLRRAGRRALTGALVCWALVLAAAFGPFLVLAPQGLWTSLSEQAARAIQIESLAGSAWMTFTHQQVITSLGAAALAGHQRSAYLASFVEAIVLVALWWGFQRGPMERARLGRYLAACVCAFVALGKVLSPQYLIWLVPLVPLAGGRRAIAGSALLAVALVATQWYFPARYGQVVSGRLAPLVLARDLALVGLIGLLALPPAADLRLAAGSALARLRRR